MRQNQMKTQMMGLIGLGNMGRPMGMNLLESGVDLTVFDINAEAMKMMATAGASQSTSPKDLASQCDMVILMLPGTTEVEQVCLGSDGIIHGASKGTLVIDMTSSLPESTKRIHDLFRQKDIRMIDAPVTGMVKGAIERSLTIIVGGDIEDFKRARPILELLGKNIYHLGPIGSGHVMKAINNLIFACCMAGTAEGVALAVRAGIDPLKATTVLQNASGYNCTTQVMLPNNVLPAKPIGWTNSLLLKDLKAFMSISQNLGVPTLMGNLVYSIVSFAEGDKDGIEFFKVYEDWFQIKMKGVSDSIQND